MASPQGTASGSAEESKDSGFFNQLLQKSSVPPQKEDTEQQQEQQPPAEDNAIMKFLKEGEAKQKQESLELNDSISQSLENAELNRSKEEAKGEKTSNSVDLAAKALEKQGVTQIDMEARILNFKDKSIIRYSPMDLLHLKNSPLVASPESLPERSFFGSPDQSVYNNSTNSRYNQKKKRNWANNDGSYSSRNTLEPTGSMGNFSINSSGGRRGYKNNNSNNNNSNNRNRSRKDRIIEQQMAEVENGMAIHDADAFAKYRESVKKGLNSSSSAPSLNETTPASTSEGYNSMPMNTADSFFGLANPDLSRSNNSAGANSAETSKNSRFLSLFNNPEPSPPQSNAQPSTERPKAPQSSASADGRSKILSFLDRGEKAAAASGSNPNSPVPSSVPLPNQPHSPAQPHQQQRSQFFNQPGSPAVVGGNASPAFPPGLGPPQPQQIPQGGSKDSFFMSLLNKHDENPSAGSPAPQQSQPQPVESPQTTKGSSKPSPEVTKDIKPQDQIRQQQQQQQQQQPQQQLQPMPGFQGLPPGLQAPPGLQQGQQPPQFNQRMQQGQFPPLPPGLNPNQLPPWLQHQQQQQQPQSQSQQPQQQFNPNMRQFPPQQGRFMPPLPNGAFPPPHMRAQNGGGAPGLPPGMMYPPPPPMGQNGMPMFFPPGQEGEQRFPPGLMPPQFNAGGGNNNGQNPNIQGGSSPVVHSQQNTGK